MPRNQFIVLVLKNPSLLLRKPEGFQIFIDTLQQFLPVTRSQILRAIRRSPQILSLLPKPLSEKLTALSSLINAPLPELTHAAINFPPLFYLNSPKILVTLQTAASALNIPLEDFVTTALRMPSLMAREPLAMARKVRLVIRIARALDIDLDPSIALRKCPALPTYAQDRLLIRWLVVKLGLWSWSWDALIPRSDAKIHALLQDYANSLPSNGTRHVKLRAIVNRRMRGFTIS